jgi:hypothetical protein
VDVTDQLVEAGVFDRGTIGLNWWATRRWKIGFDYGLIELDRFGIRGVTPPSMDGCSGRSDQGTPSQSVLPPS